jgi:hypothetical protein
MTDATTYQAPRPARPGIITALAVLGALQGLFGVVMGIFVVVQRDDDDLLRQINDSEELADHHITSDTLLTFGIIAIVLGTAIIVLAVLLSKGNNIVRWAFAIIAAANAAGALYAVLEYEGSQRMSGAYTLSFSLFVLWVLFGNQRVDDYFEASHTAT